MARAPAPGSHVCGHLNKHKRPGEHRRGRCQHIVSDDSGYRYCEDHRDGIRELWAGRVYRSKAPISTAASPGQSAGRGPARFTSGRGWKDDGVPDAAVDIAVESARTIATNDWVHRSERRVSTALGPEIAQRARTCNASALCRELADLAEALLAAKGWAIRTIENAASPLLSWFVKPTLARVVARQFGTRLVSVAGVDVTATAPALRAYGVLLCVLDGRDLARCRCLRQIAGSGSPQRIRAEVRGIVGHGLEPLV